MAKSTYYFEIYKTDAVAIRNQDLMGEIQEIFKKNKGRYGVRRVHRELLNRGHIQVHFKNGRPMFPSSIFHGANAICRQSWI